MRGLARRVAAVALRCPQELPSNLQWQIEWRAEKLLDNNISVVAANKLAASSQQKIYQLLKDTARKRNVKYLFETNVGVGLPIINTMNNLINNDDHYSDRKSVV